MWKRPDSTRDFFFTTDSILIDTNLAFSPSKIWYIFIIAWMERDTKKKREKKKKGGGGGGGAGQCTSQAPTYSLCPCLHHVLRSRPERDQRCRGSSPRRPGLVDQVAHQGVPCLKQVWADRNGVAVDSGREADGEGGHARGLGPQHCVVFCVFLVMRDREVAGVYIAQGCSPVVFTPTSLA